MKLVIDQNRLRIRPNETNTPLETYLAACGENMAVLTDTAVFEMLKGSAPVYVASKSLQILSSFPDQVVATDGTGVLMVKELSEQCAITTLENPELTRRLRELLRRARRFYDGQEKEFPIDAAVVARESVKNKAQRLNHDQHKIMLNEGVKTFELAAPHLQQKLHRGTFDKEVYQFLYQAGFCGFRDAIADRNLPPETVQQLYLAYCLTARVSMTGILWALQWYKTGGADSLKKERATNQFIDIDYVICASYFDGILSEDGRVNDLYSSLKDLLEGNHAN